MLHQCGMVALGRIVNNTTQHCPPGNFSMSSAAMTSTSFQKVVELYLISVFCVIGICGNSLSLIVLRKDENRHRGLILLQGLAAADTLYLVTAVLRYPTKYVMYDMDVYLRMQLYVFPLLKIAQSICIWMMVLVTIDRYIHVCLPLRATRINPCYRRIGPWLLFACACVFNLPRFFDSCLMTFKDMCRNRVILTQKVYSPSFNQTLYFDLYNFAAYIVLLYVGPLLILTILNSKLIRAIRHSMKRQRRFGAHNEQNENNATLVLVIIVITFILCETPELIVKTLSFLDRWFTSISLSVTLLSDLSTTNEFLMVVNSAANFFIYCVFGKRFRFLLMKTLFPGKSRKSHLHAHVQGRKAEYQMKPLVNLATPPKVTLLT